MSSVFPPPSSGCLVDVLRPQHFVDDPVEDVKHQEGKGEDSPGDSIDPLGPVNVAPMDCLSLPQEWGWGRRAVDAGTLHGTSILHL